MLSALSRVASPLTIPFIIMRLQPRASLLASTALSASYPTCLKLIYAADGAPLSPVVITALRFSLMAAGSMALLRPASDSNDNGGFWLAAAELGFWATAGAQLNTAALQQVSVVRGTVLLATINVLTPGLSAIIGATEEQRRVALRTWAACAMALGSTVYALVEDAPAAVPLALDLSPGDEIMLGAACCFAMQQVRLGCLVADYPAQQLAAARLQMQAACSLAFLPIAGSAAAGAVSLDVAQWTFQWPAKAGEWTSDALVWASQLSATQAGLLSLSACTAVLGLLLQYEGQRAIPAASAQPIYAASPILSALWAFLVLSEPISSHEVIGGLGLGCAALLASAPAGTVSGRGRGAGV